MLSWMDWLIVGSAAISVFTTRSSTCVHRWGQGHAVSEQEEEDGGGCVCVAASCVRVSERVVHNIPVPISGYTSPLLGPLVTGA